MLETAIATVWRKQAWFAGLVALALAALPAADAAASPRDAIAAGDMQAVTREVVDLYKRHGLSWADWIGWKIGPFTTTYWYYDLTSLDIIAGDMPKPDQVDAYWQAFADALTDGQWKPAGFFVSDADALEMARFNQWILATHESAHAITYRYDPDHTQRHDFDINCREYHADRITAAIMQDEADHDPDMARWRARYLDLVTAMGAAIPDAYKVVPADYAALEARCEVIAIDQPTPDRLQAYASAYFTRYKALLEARLPPLDAVFETHLKARLADTATLFPPMEGWSGRSVETTERHENIHDNYIFRARHLPGDYAYGAGGFGPDGTKYVAEASYDTERDRITVGFGPAGDALEIVLEDFAWPRDPHGAEITSMAVFGPEAFAAAFKEGDNHASILMFRKSGGTWRMTPLVEADGYGTASVFRSTQNGLLAGFSRSRAQGALDKSWRLAGIDPDSGAETWSVHIPVQGDNPIGADAEGRLYFGFRRMIVGVGADGTPYRFAGNGLDGNADGDVATAQFSDPNLLQFTADGGALILDTDVTDEAMQFTRAIPASD